jgi:hypothetical protein
MPPFLVDLDELLRPFIQGSSNGALRMRRKTAALVGCLVVASVAVAILLLNRDAGNQGFFSAGSIDDFPVSSIKYFPEEHFFLARTHDGEFVAVYDLDKHVQNLVDRGDSSQASCRLRTSSLPPELARLDTAISSGKLTPVVGLEQTVLVDSCYGDTFDAIGRFAFGPSAQDLDRFTVKIKENQVLVASAELVDE